ATSARAEKRVAFVVGNANYNNVSALANPTNDARDMAEALTGLGFTVILGLDLDKRGFDLKTRDFVRALEGADVGVFFYAGHGLQVGGVNYLVATDAKLEAERDLDFETIKLDFVLQQMEREAKTNIVFLDACRNNPLTRNLARTMGTRGVSENGGLAPVASGLGTFIAYATQPGNVASDGSGRNSPFTTALKKHVTETGLAISDLMIEVRRDVVAATRGAQVPWDHSALQGRFFFRPGETASQALASNTPAPGRTLTLPARIGRRQGDSEGGAGFLGVQVASIQEAWSATLGLSGRKGAWVTGLAKGGPSEFGRLLPGDVILSVQGRSVDDARSFTQAVASQPPDQVVNLEIWRIGDGGRDLGQWLRRQAEADDSGAVHALG